jgi:hypothetical protein
MEVIPQVGRNFEFALTVRDNVALMVDKRPLI